MEKNDLIPFSSCVVIGGSAGSLKVLLQVIPQLNTGLPFPIIIVVHRKNDPNSSLEQLLNERSSITVKEAEDKEELQPGIVYLAPSDYHLLVEKDRSFSLDGSEKVLWSRPSIDVTFQSVADVFATDTLGILLSGGNNDGTEGLLEIRHKGGKIIIQDPDNAEIITMPTAALAQLQPDQLLPDHAIANAINTFR